MNYIDEVKEELAKHIRVGKGLMNIYSLIVLIKGENATLKDIHDGWAININQTWDFEKYGNHRSLVAFDSLQKSVQDKDQGYLDAIHKTAVILALKKTSRS